MSTRPTSARGTPRRSCSRSPRSSSSFLERRLGGPRTVLLALSASGTCLGLIVLAPVFTGAASLFVLRGFFTTLSWPFHQSLLMAATVPEDRATAVGSGFAVWGFTNALGPLASGALLGAGVFVLPLLVGSLMYFCGGLAFGIGFGRLLTRTSRVSAAVGTIAGHSDP